uniref:Uncharacterized protein n=1 Tax=Rhizophora mucronata TaxID=61149 RepID=A0A2P2NTE6_RHIMU
MSCRVTSRTHVLS